MEMQAYPPSLFIFFHDFRRIIKTRRGDAARRPNGGSIPFCTPSLCLRKKRAQKTYIFATTVEVKLQVMEEPPPFGPAQHLPAGSGKRLPGPDGRVNLSGAQGGNPFNGQGGAAAENALPSFDPAFLGGRQARVRNRSFSRRCPLFHHPPVRAPLIKVNSSTY